MENEVDLEWECEYCGDEFATQTECDIHEHGCASRPMLSKSQKASIAALLLLAAVIGLWHRLPEIRCAAMNGVTLGPVHLDRKLANLGVLKAADGWRIDRVETTPSAFKVYLCCGAKGEEQWAEIPFEEAPRGK